MPRQIQARPVLFVGSGPGNPDQLTLAAARALAEADIIIHDRLVPQVILEMAGCGAHLVAAGKEGYGPSVPQAAINGLIIGHAATGAQVVRLKSGDPAVFGRLDEEIEAVDRAGLDYRILPGITAASAAAAAAGHSLTLRGRNSELRLITARDMDGFAEQDWRALARPGAVAAIYMGKRAARFLQGRLLMHGADPETPATLVANASRPDERVISAELSSLGHAAIELDGPAVILLGIAARNAREIFAAADLEASQ